ncbi:MAG: hypothetical protein KGM95_07245, partial [Betaproteobacteria bacterium]|nr:hypothetical protein [Betaproteobacteria bacterium]
MASVQAVRSRIRVPGFILGTMMSCLAVPAVADPDIDLEFSNIQDLQEVARQDGKVAFTFHTLARNVGNKSIPWGFPVKKPSSLPIGDHDHNVPRAVTEVNFGKSDTVGPHPHLRFFLYRHLPGGEPEKIGESDLKHAFRAGGGDSHHLLPVKGSDSYSPANNRDRSFYSPAAEDMFNEQTGEILVHEHMGRDTGQSVGGFRVFERDHRDADHPSPLTHLLQASIADLDPVRNPDGTRWFLAGTYYVAGDRDATPANDFFANADNTRWVQIQPKNASTRFKFDYPGVTGSGLDQIREKPMPEAQTRGGGGGRTESMGPPPSSFFFSKG